MVLKNFFLYSSGKCLRRDIVSGGRRVCARHNSSYAKKAMVYHNVCKCPMDFWQLVSDIEF